MTWSHPLTVRYADTDAQGVVFFANYLTYFDEGMSAFLHAIGCPPRELTAEGADFVYADARCSYRGSATFDDRLEVAVHVERIGTTSLVARYAVRRVGEAEPLALGECVHVCIDPATRRKRPVPERLREAVARFQGG